MSSMPDIMVQRKLEDLLRSSVDELDEYFSPDIRFDIIDCLDHGEHGAAWHQLWHLIRNRNLPVPKAFVEYEEIIRSLPD